ncbi:MAG: hypothetical protein ABIQ38_08000 [Ilumatobacteraceae bacterium]
MKFLNRKVFIGFGMIAIGIFLVARGLWPILIIAMFPIAAGSMLSSRSKVVSSVYPSELGESLQRRDIELKYGGTINPQAMNVDLTDHP